MPIAKEKSITTQNIGTCKCSYTKGYVHIEYEKKLLFENL